MSVIIELATAAMTTLLNAPKLQLVNTSCVKAKVEDHAFNVGEAFSKLAKMSNDITIIGNDGSATLANRLLLGVFSPTLRPILFDQLTTIPTIIIPDLSSNAIKHLVNLLGSGSSASHSVAFKDLHDITEAAKTLQIDLTDIVWETIKQEPKIDISEQAKDCDVDIVIAGNANPENSDHITDASNPDIDMNDQTTINSVGYDQVSITDDDQASVKNDQTSGIKIDQVRNYLSVGDECQTNFDELPFSDKQNVSSVSVEIGSLPQPNQDNYKMLLGGQMENLIKDEIMIRSEVSDYESHEIQSNLYQTNSEIDNLANIDHDNIKMFINHTEPSLYNGNIDDGNYKMNVNHAEQTGYDNFERLKDNAAPSIDDNTFANAFNLSSKDSLETLSESSMEIPQVNATLIETSMEIPQVNSTLIETSMETPQENGTPIETSMKIPQVNGTIIEPSMEIPQENENKALKTVCQVCSKEEINFTTLKTHYIASHFGGKLKLAFGALVAEKTCVLCNKAFSSMANAFRHIGYAHNKLNEILVQDGLIPLPDSSYGGSSKRKSEKHDVSSKKLKTDSDINTERLLVDLDGMSDIKVEEIGVTPAVEDLFQKTAVEDILREETSVKMTNDIEENDKGDDDRDPLTCQICNLKKSTTTILQQHYINSHYTRKLKDRYEHLIVGNYCNDCDIQFKSVIKALGHLGIEHQKLNEILDEEGFLVLIPTKQEDISGLSKKIISVKAEDDELKDNDKYVTDDKSASEEKKVINSDVLASFESVDKSEKDIVAINHIEAKKESVELKLETQTVLLDKIGTSKEEINLIANTTAKFMCDVCAATFEKKNGFIRHTLTNRHYFTCDICETNFRKKDKFESHKIGCLPKKNETPSALDNDDESKVNIESNVSEKENGNDELVVKNESETMEPISKIKTESATKTEAKRTTTAIACEICGEKFDNKKNFFRHCLMKNHYFTCDICGKSFKKKMEYTTHQKSCTI